MPFTGPLLLSPRLDPKPWGGSGLGRFGFDLPTGELIGEALITAAEAIILNAPNTGRTLGDMVGEDPIAAIGQRGLALTRQMPLFPLLIKLIDANQDLSIQVHPTDETAPEGSLGKSEAWHVLHALPGAVLYLGLADGVDPAELETIARRGESTAHLMRSVPATPGMTVYLPAGTVHALGAGVVIYEIQQPSAITYRLDDWGRVDEHGRGRELHLDAGFAALDPDSRPEPLVPRPMPADAGQRARLVTTPFFAAEAITLDAGDELDLRGDGGPQVFTVLAGACRIASGRTEVEVGSGQTVTTLAAAERATITAREPITLLRGMIDAAA